MPSHVLKLDFVSCWVDKDMLRIMFYMQAQSILDHDV